MTNAYSCDSKRSYMRYSSKKVQCYLISQNEKGKDKKKSQTSKDVWDFFIMVLLRKYRYNYSAAGASSSAGAATSAGASAATGASTGAFSGTTLTATLISTSLWK